MIHADAMKLVTAILLAAAILVPQSAQADHPPSQIVVEFGAAQPKGDLAADFYDTRLGLGAASGLELGFRWRYRFNDNFSLSPSFHFINYKDLRSTDPVVGDFRIPTSSFRYCLELMWVFGAADSGLRPFIAAAGGVYRNRVEGFYKTFEQAFDESVNTLGGSLRAGFRIAAFEVSVIYSVNRFATWRFFDTGFEEDYDWDNAGVRVGWIIPFGE
jgi:hypothetical protein